MAGMGDILDQNDNLVRKDRELRQMGTGEEPPAKKAAARAAGITSPAPDSTQTGIPDKYSMPRKDGESIDDHSARVAAARAAYIAKNGKAPTGD